MSACILCGLDAPSARAWGQRGHHLVTRVAVRILAARHAEPKLIAPFDKKTYMLAHLSNIPDILWRNGSKQTIKWNGPTHYVDLEYLHPEPTFSNLPKTLTAARKRIRTLCRKEPPGYKCPEDGATKPRITQAGTAPWRIAQLYRLMSEDLGRAANKPSSKKGSSQDKPGPAEQRAAVDKALLHGGLLSHFVADLGNPWHTTRDYDGWETGQGGIHSYFETKVVATAALDLDAQVLAEALEEHPFRTASKALAQKDNDYDAHDPLAVAFALALDSFSELKRARKLDKNHALKKPSRQKEGNRREAVRKLPAKAEAGFHDFLVERLAIAADTLAHLWYRAWVTAGKPDLSGYHSYAYPTEPAFIAPLEKKRAPSQKG